MPRRSQAAVLKEENKILRATLKEYEERLARQQPTKVLYTRNGKSPFEAARFHLGQVPIAMRNYSHNDHPGYYKDPTAEYWDNVLRAAMWDVGAAERQVEITGSDTPKFVQMLTTRDMEQCQFGNSNENGLGLKVKDSPDSVIPCDEDAKLLGQCKYSFLTLPHGGIYNDPVILRLEENRFWISLADTDVLPVTQALWWGLMRGDEKMDVQIREPDVGPFQIQGPNSKYVIQELLGELPSYTNKKDERMPIRYYWNKKYFKEFGNDLDGIEFVVSRTGYSGELGYEIYVINATEEYTGGKPSYPNATNAGEMWVRCYEAGRKYDLTVTGPCHIRRIEGGILALGPDADMWWDTNPFEVEKGLEWMVDFRNERNDFMGRAALEEIKINGIARKLIGVDIDNEDGQKNLGAYIDGSMPNPFPVYKGKKPIGKVTSACYSPRLAKNIGYAMLAIDYTEIGTEFIVETPLGMLPAMAVQKPHWDPKKEIPKQ